MEKFFFIDEVPSHNQLIQGFLFNLTQLAPMIKNIKYNTAEVFQKTKKGYLHTLVIYYGALRGLLPIDAFMATIAILICFEEVI